MLTHLIVRSLDATGTLCGLADGPEFPSAVVRADTPESTLLATEDVCRECARRLARDLGLPIVYVIPEENRVAVSERAAKLNRRAEKLGVPPITITFAHHHVQRWSVGEGSERREFAREWIAATVEGAAVRLGGWTFLATLHHTTDGNIIAAMPGHEVPREYRNAPSACHHCKTTRRRNATYLLEEVASGKVLQVGTDCLQDFLGGDPHKFASWAELLGAFDAWFTPMEEEGGRPRTEWAFSLAQFLDATVRVVRVNGWVSKKRASETNDPATASSVWRYLTVPSGTKEARELDQAYAPLPEDAETTRRVLEWAEGAFSAEDRTDRNDYEHNLAVVIRSGLVNLRVAGLAASIVQAWRRATQVAEERKQSAEGPQSAHVGTVGERLRDLPITIAAVIPMPPTEFGPRELVKMKDDAGNIFAWFTGSLGAFHFASDEAGDAVTARAPEPGDRMWLTGTVKKHSSFAGAAQTELSRCALASVAPIVKVKKSKKVTS